MDCLFFADVVDAVPTAWALLAISFIAGLIAVISPKSLTRSSDSVSGWVDTSRLCAVVDRQTDKDHWLPRHSQRIGIVMIGATVLAALALFLKTNI